MENLEQKTAFLRSAYTPLLAQLNDDAPRKWGKMNVQQMIEHMSDYVRIASGKTPVETITPVDKIPRMQGFLASEKPFAENTPNSLMSEIPLPVRHDNKAAAIQELQNELYHFFAVHEGDNARATPNPFFGTLNFQQQVQLLHKHATHHLRQFGIDA